MFNQVSMAGTGAAIITLINLILPALGFDIPEGTVAAAVEGVVNVAGFAFLIWGQARRTDLIGGLIRK